MIDAKELRVGNKVLSDRCIVTVKYINEHLTVTTKQGNDISARMELIKAIELTPEILEKAGFKIREGYEHYANRDVYVKIGWHNSFQVGYELDWNNLVHIQTLHSLHELQNFFFVITREELPIQL